MNSFAEMLTYLRKREGMSQQELADKIGMSRSVIGMYESGQRQASIEVLEAIADTFNVNIDFLIGHVDSGSYSRTFRENLEHIISQYNHADIEAAGIDKQEVDLVISGAIPLSLDYACELADQLGETLDNMLGIDMSATDTGDGQDVDGEIISLLSRLSSDKVQEALNYLRYLVERGEA